MVLVCFCEVFFMSFYQFMKSIKQNGSWLSSISTRLSAKKTNTELQIFGNPWKPQMNASPSSPLSIEPSVTSQLNATVNSEICKPSILSAKIEVGGMAREMAGTPQITCTCLSFLGKLMRFFGFLRARIPFLPREQRCLCGCQEPRSGLLPNALQVVDLGSLEELGFGCEKKTEKIERNCRSSPGFCVSMLKISFKNKETTTKSTSS